ncbi:MAG: fasciclin protein [Paucimonas sp.]|nr:fasciclin protein [Paucimonas sp.]
MPRPALLAPVTLPSVNFLWLLLAAAIASWPGPGHAADLLETADVSATFKNFVGAAKKSGLQETLKNGGPYTVFAPTDEAISKFGADRWQALEKDKPRMSQLLMRHVVPGKMLVSEVKPGPVTSVAGSAIKLKSDNGKVTVGTANVTQSDMLADNGVIHAIDQVLVDD